MRLLPLLCSLAMTPRILEFLKTRIPKRKFPKENSPLTPPLPNLFNFRINLGILVSAYLSVFFHLIKGVKNFTNSL